MLNTHFVLASSSPRRIELIEKLGIEFEAHAPNIEEKLDYFIPPEEAIMEVAVQKANAVKENFPDSLIFAADTVVLINGDYLGKPANEEEATQMLDRLSGKIHEVITGCALVENDQVKTFYSTATVYFDNLKIPEIDEYVKTGEPLNKAGAYAIQGYGSRLISKINGDFYAVMGLPVNKLYKALKYYKSGNLFSKCNLM